MSGFSGPGRRYRVASFLLIAVVGSLGFGLLADAGPRAAASFVGGLLLACGAFGFGAFNIRLVDRFAPQLTMVVAVFSYALTAVALALVLASASPRVVHAEAIAVGLIAGVVWWLGFELATTITRPEARSERL